MSSRDLLLDCHVYPRSTAIHHIIKIRQFVVAGIVSNYLIVTSHLLSNVAKFRTSRLALVVLHSSKFILFHFP